MSKKHFPIMAIAAIAAVIMLGSGCGYSIGYISHPQMESIAVAPVVNETINYNGSALLRNVLAEKFMTDGSMKLKSLKSADCILYARILEVKYSASDSLLSDSDPYIPEEWTAEVTVEYSVIVPGRPKPLIPATKLSAKALFLREADLESARYNGLRQALNDAAKKIVYGVTEAW